MRACSHGVGFGRSADYTAYRMLLGWGIRPGKCKRRAEPGSIQTQSLATCSAGLAHRSKRRQSARLTGPHTTQFFRWRLDNNNHCRSVSAPDLKFLDSDNHISWRRRHIPDRVHKIPLCMHQLKTRRKRACRGRTRQSIRDAGRVAFRCKTSPRERTACTRACRRPAHVHACTGQLRS